MITYIATNTETGKFYIGSTTNLEKRKKSHLTNKVNYPFQNVLRKNPEAFDWQVFEDDCDEPVLEQALLDMWYGKEQCYNLSPRADQPSGWRGKNLSASHKQKLREANLGNKNPAFGIKRPEHSKRMSGENNPNFGRTGEKHPRFGKKDVAHSEAMSKCRWWVNEASQTRFQPDCPGPEWKPGRKWRN
jgi:group I intron endonuclease